MNLSFLFNLTIYLGDFITLHIVCIFYVSLGPLRSRCKDNIPDETPVGGSRRSQEELGSCHKTDSEERDREGKLVRRMLDCNPAWQDC